MLAWNSVVFFKTDLRFTSLSMTGACETVVDPKESVGVMADRGLTEAAERDGAARIAVFVVAVVKTCSRAAERTCAQGLSCALYLASWLRHEINMRLGCVYST